MQFFIHAKLNNKLKLFLFVNLSIICLNVSSVEPEQIPVVGLYRTFEFNIENTNKYANKFADIELTCTYFSPSGDTIKFMGFFDGNGDGSGDLTTGNTWKTRFIPDETGMWGFMWEWSDATQGGEGSFRCDSTNAGKGILRPYKENPRWFAYNGTEPVWLKSYYESGHGSIAQDFDWIKKNVYNPMIDRGYNHFQVNWLLSLCCFDQFYNDGPAMTTNDLLLYESGKASSTMRLDVWHMMEKHVSWLNDLDIGLHMFLGFDGDKNGTSAWDKLSETEKDFYVKYVVARLAPFANIAGWSFVWEVPGDRQSHELGWAKLVKKYDIFDHLRTYQDEHPKNNEYNRPEYNFAAIENHYIHSSNRDEDRPYWKEPWTHHEACLYGYVPGKPVYMIEGNALWRRFWQSRTGATRDDLRQAAWACVTAGASFNWCGQKSEEGLVAFGPEGIPFHGDANEYAVSALQIDILTDIMTNELAFYKMKPSDSLLSEHDSKAVWCLSEQGEQYLVFSTEGKPFTLKVVEGEYKGCKWVNVLTSAGIEMPPLTAKVNENIAFTPPDTEKDWVLLIRKKEDGSIKEQSNILSAHTDTTGTEVIVKVDKKIIIPEGYKYGFTLIEKGSLKKYTINTIYSNSNEIIIKLDQAFTPTKEIHLSYEGTLSSNNGEILAYIKEMDVQNNTIEKPVVQVINSMQSQDYSIFPNPCKKQLEISCVDEIDKIQVINQAGVPVLEKLNQGHACELHLENHANGMYIVSIKTGNSIYYKNFIKID